MTDALTRLAAALADRYRIERELGEGGMAVVYLAEDLKHHRKVALKVLKPELAALVGAERFLGEIETTAHLQHPHILPLFDSGEADSFLYYVMPYVEGESLRDRIDREHQLPVDEAVRITSDLAEALDYAHRQGVIHRDIKPANILMHEGRPLIADFGIALAVGAAGGARLTETGLSVGTPYYMSPEQATGDVSVGPPSDIYALGCVLYEMLVGEPPYTGHTAQAVLGRIIQGAPVSATGERASVPANVDAAIRRALEKLPADRFTTAKDFAAALGDRTFRHGEGLSSGPAAARWKRIALATGSAVALLLVALGWSLLRPAPVPVVSRFGLAFAPGQAPLDHQSPTLALAPDGSFIVYVGRGSGPNGAGPDQLWLKRRDRFEATPLPGTDSAFVPAVSADGKWISFQVGAQLRKVPVAGGAVTVLADSASVAGRSPVAWLEDGSIVYVDTSWRLRRLPAASGTADSVWAPTSKDVRFPWGEHPLPHSRGVLFTMCNASCTSEESWVLDLRTGKAHMVVKKSVGAWYAPTGQLVYVRSDGGVFAVPFDLKLLETRGSPVSVLEGVKVDQGTTPDFVLGPDGTLLMMTGAAGVRRGMQLVWVTRDGRATPVDSTWTFDPGDVNRGWSISPDGTRIALRKLTDAGEDIYVKKLPRGPLSRLTFDPKSDKMPRWSPDGTQVIFLSNRGGNFDVWAKRADGTGKPTLVYHAERSLAAALWTPDGKWLVVRTSGAGGVVGGRDILAIRPGIDTVPKPLLTKKFDESAPAVSPDSRLIAYDGRETDRDQIFVRPFPDVTGGRWQVSTNGGLTPLWAHNGRELFYFDLNRDLVDVKVDTRNGFRIGERTVLFHLGDEYEAPTLDKMATGHYDITADDQRFLFGRWVGSSEDSTRVVLVENWSEELKAKLKAQR